MMLRWLTQLIKVSRRNPIITIMGHVDHGKTTLLDRLRTSRIASMEAGGITQKLAAFTLSKSHLSHLGQNGFSCSSGDEKVMTVIDTPGHAAFKTIRSRGARIADIVVLVVAADDGVMPQTRECIELSKADNVPLIIALNKIDKLGPSGGDDNGRRLAVRRVEEQLGRAGVMTEGMGGEVQLVPISAFTGENVPNLLEAIMAQAEQLELSKTDEHLEAMVLEAQLLHGVGPCCTALVRSGQIRTGDHLVIDGVMGRVRKMVDCDGQCLEVATESEPVLVSGWDDLPPVGGLLVKAGSERHARQLASEFRRLSQEDAIKESQKEAKRLHAISRKILEDKREAAQNPARIRPTIFEVVAGDCKKQSKMPIIIAADSVGSMEALEACLSGIPQQKASIEVVDKRIGLLTPSDVEHALASKATLVAFNSETPKAVRRQAEIHKVALLEHTVIYHLIEAVSEALCATLPPIIQEELVGKVRVLQLFPPSKGDSLPILGCHVIFGAASRNADIIRLLRGNRVILPSAAIQSMRQQKENVHQVGNDQECGLVLKKHDGVEVQPMDELHFLSRVSKPASLVG